MSVDELQHQVVDGPPAPGDEVTRLLGDLVSIASYGTEYSTLDAPDVVDFGAGSTAEWDYGREFASIAIVNPEAVPLYIGLGASAGQPGREFVQVPALGWLVLPLRARGLSIGGGAYAGNCYVLPFRIPQSFSAGLIGAATGTPEPAASSTVAKVALTGAEQVLLAANAARRGATIYNDAATTVYVKLGDAATADDWTVALFQNDYFEVPAGYAGIVTAIAVAAIGQARVTEIGP